MVDGGREGQAPGQPGDKKNQGTLIKGPWDPARYLLVVDHWRIIRNVMIDKQLQRLDSGPSGGAVAGPPASWPRQILRRIYV
jgi:hypothetical protein